MAWRTARMEPARVIVPGPGHLRPRCDPGHLLHRGRRRPSGSRVGLGGVFVFGASTLGLTFYAGMLERLVGSVERNEPAQPVLVVLRTLPWGRLLVARGDPARLGAVASLLLVIPGLIVGTLFALVGPLINLLDTSVPEAFRRSLKLVWPHFMLVFCFMTLPLAVEHEVVVLVADLVPHEHIWAVFLTTFILGDLFGMALGLMEVTLAERLVTGAQGPGAGPTVGGRGAARSGAPIQSAREPRHHRVTGGRLKTSGQPHRGRSDSKPHRSDPTTPTLTPSEEAHHGRDDPRNDDAGARALARRRRVHRVRGRRVQLDVRRQSRWPPTPAAAWAAKASWVPSSARSPAPPS